MDLMEVSSTSTSSRDTGSDYGQFDRAVSQAVNNPAPSQPSGPPGWLEIHKFNLLQGYRSTTPSVGGDDH